MKIFNKLINQVENLLIKDSEKTRELVKITALAVCVDNKVYPEEIEASKTLLVEHFEKSEMSFNQIELLLKQFDELIKKYTNNKALLSKDKLWIKELISKSTQEEKETHFKYLLEIFGSDGYIGEDEGILLKEFNTQNK